MAYDPAEATTRDRIRGLIGDTAATAIFADATYDSVIALYEITGYAVAEMALRMARYVEAQVTSVSSPGDGSVAWSAGRAKALYALADQHQAAANAEAIAANRGKVVTITADYLTGGDDMEVWPDV